MSSVDHLAQANLTIGSDPHHQNAFWNVPYRDFMNVIACFEQFLAIQILSAIQTYYLYTYEPLMVEVVAYPEVIGGWVGVHQQRGQGRFHSYLLLHRYPGA